MSAYKHELDRYLDRTNAMTVKELREALEDYPDEMPVVFAYNYGDHWRTEVAERVGDVEEGEVLWSAYHRMPKTADQDEGEPDEEDDGKSEENVNVLILRA